VTLTPEQKEAALEFDRNVWRRWAAKEITTDEACMALDHYLESLKTSAATEAKHE
jgi:hypothetical protein